MFAFSSIAANLKQIKTAAGRQKAAAFFYLYLQFYLLYIILSGVQEISKKEGNMLEKITNTYPEFDNISFR